MTDKSRSALTAGIAAGVLFLGAAWIPYSRWYPFLVPLICGVLATYLVGRSSPVNGREGLALGLKTGAIGATIFFAIGGPLTYLILRNVAASRWVKAGEVLPIRKFLLVMFICALIGMLLAVMGSTAAVPLFGRRGSQPV